MQHAAQLARANASSHLAREMSDSDLRETIDQLDELADTLRRTWR